MNTTVEASAREPQPQTQRLSGRLGVGSIVFMVVAAAGPLTVVGGGAPVGILLGNGVGYPALFPVLGVIFALFAVGLSAMTARFPKSGAFFSVIGHGLGPGWGAAGAHLALLTYVGIQIAVYAFLGLQLETFLGALLGITVPWWVWTLFVIVGVGVLGYRRIDVSAKVLGVLLVLEVAVVLVLSLVIVFTGGAEGITFDSFTPSNVFSGSVGIGIMFAAASFVGFESTLIYRDEARDPKRTIPRATYATLALITVFYIFATWALVVAWGSTNVQSVAESTMAAGDMLQQTGVEYVGDWYAMAISVLIITSMFACVLSFHNVLTRYYRAMGLAGLLPVGVSRVHPRHQSPSAASLLQTAVPAVLVIMFAIVGLDPYAQVFTWFSGVATLSFLTLMSGTCVAVLWYFARHRVTASTPGESASLWQRLIAPGIALIGLAGLIYAVVVNFPLLVGDVDAAGDPAAGGLTIALLALVVAFPVIGGLQASYLKRFRTKQYTDLTNALS